MGNGTPAHGGHGHGVGKQNFFQEVQPFMVREASPASIAWCLDVGTLVEEGPPLLWFRARRGAGQPREAQQGLQSAKPLLRARGKRGEVPAQGYVALP